MPPPSRRPPRRRRRRRRIAFETRLLLLALATGAIGVLAALLMLWLGEYTLRLKWTLTLFIVLPWLAFALSLQARVVHPLQTLSNMLAALREGDFSLRARVSRSDDALGEVMAEANALSAALREQSLAAAEAGALLRKVMAEIDVAVFAFDALQHLQLVNRAGERLLGMNGEQALGRTAAELGLGECLLGPSPRTTEMSFNGIVGRWGLRRSTFRQGGVPLDLLVIADLSAALREQERQAWQRLLRVLGHELNNSLAPVRSIAESLLSLRRRDPRPHDWEEDMDAGLKVIAERAEALSRFMRDYSRLARLPRPRVQPVDLDAVVRHVIGLETRLPVQFDPGPRVLLQADPDQLEQALINLLRNAVDASLETGGTVAMGWTQKGGAVEVWVRDEGHGVSDEANLFVPFFTTKPGGSGIGLALCRQIAEAHGGMVTLQNRSTRGCEGRLRLPLS